MEQRGFADLEYTTKKRTTRKERFLSEMDRLLPWSLLLKPIKSRYPKSKRGRKAIPAEVMLRIYFMQQWYGLSDPAMEDSLYDIESMRRFAQIDLQHIPDETTICKFRHFLERHRLTEKLFELSREEMSSQGLILSEGTIVDASIIAAPSSTKNASGKRDPEMGSTKKGNTWHFGMKAHIGTDTQGRVHRIEVTNASVHDSVMMAALLHGEEQAIYGDKAYASRERKEWFESMGGCWRVNRKAGNNRRLRACDHAFNRKSNRVRARVEHAFGVVKHLWGYRKVRYRGLAKNTAQVFTLFMLANFYMARQAMGG